MAEETTHDGAAAATDRATDPVAYPTWDRDTLRQVAAYGTVRATTAGEVLLRAGHRTEGFYVVLEGALDVIRPGVDGPSEVVGHLQPGQHVGAVSLLTGQRPYLDVVVAEAGRVIDVDPDGFRRLMGANRRVATSIFDTARSRSGDPATSPAAQTIRIVGSRYSAESLALRAFATRSRVPHTWVDLDEVEDPDVVLASNGLGPGDVPAVVTPAGALPNATPGDLAARLGLTFDAPPGYTFDLVVVGGGPAGLAAAVYGAAEGLETVALDAVATGGQAGTSSLIENYAGFPNGIAGGELTSRTAAQARRLGARINVPCEVDGLRPGRAFHTLTLTDGSEVPARAVVVATGARYRRLPLPELARYEGAGVYYAATAVEVKGCKDGDVVVVGAGNSAGQAALFLAEQGARVAIVVRGDGLEATMSRYLIARIEGDPRIDVRCRTEVRALQGEGHLDRITLEHTPTGRRDEAWCAGLFCFIGAEPATDWLGGAVALDDKGFVLTDRELPGSVTSGRAFAGRPPLPFETSVPGVFAVGDVRSGSLKRVAAAVGEGSSAVRSVHDHLSGA